MVDTFYNMPNFVLFIFISFITILISFIAVIFVNQFISLTYRYRENEALVSVSAIIGVIYAILVGFTILYELNNYNKADQAEIEEAKTAFTIFRLAHMLPEKNAETIRVQIVNYLQNVIDNEWPSMIQGKHVNDEGINIIEKIFKQLHFAKNVKLKDIQLNSLNNISMSTNTLFNLHEDRVSKLHTSLSPNLWFVILLGAFLTIGINLILGMEFRLHLACIAGVALMVSGIIFLIVTLDRPYRGDFPIKPNTFKSTLEYLNLHRNIEKDIAA